MDLMSNLTCFYGFSILINCHSDETDATNYKEGSKKIAKVAKMSTKQVVVKNELEILSAKQEAMKKELEILSTKKDVVKK